MMNKKIEALKKELETLLSSGSVLTSSEVIQKALELENYLSGKSQPIAS